MLTEHKPPIASNDSKNSARQPYQMDSIAKNTVPKQTAMQTECREIDEKVCLNALEPNTKTTLATATMDNANRYRNASMTRTFNISGSDSRIDR